MALNQLNHTDVNSKSVIVNFGEKILNTEKVIKETTRRVYSRTLYLLLNALDLGAGDLLDLGVAALHLLVHLVGGFSRNI